MLNLNFQTSPWFMLFDKKTKDSSAFRADPTTSTILDKRLFRRLRKSDEDALTALCKADTRWNKYYHGHQSWLDRAIKDLRGVGRTAFGCFSPVENKTGGFSSSLDACIFLKVSEFDNSAELKNFVFRNGGARDDIPKVIMSALTRLIEETARYCETREISKLEIELPQSEHSFISLFLKQGFRVAALRERYNPGQSVCILEKKIGGTYYADPFDLAQLGKWLLHALLPCKVTDAKRFQLTNYDGVPYLEFEIHPAHPAFSFENPIAYKRRLRGWMVILDEPECSETNIRQIVKTKLRDEGQLHYVLARVLPRELRTLLQDSGINCFDLAEVKAIAGGDRSSLSIPMQQSDVGGVLTVLEQEQIEKYSRFTHNFVYYLLGGIGGALPKHASGNESAALLAVYCPSWSDGNSGIVAVAEIDEIASSSFEQAFELYREIPKALTPEDLAYYRTWGDKDRIHVLKCSSLHILPRRLDMDDRLWTNQMITREYICRELEETNSAYIDNQTCESLRQYLRTLKSMTANVSSKTEQQLDKKEGLNMDPITTMAAIGSGLSLVDKFVDLVRKLRTGDQKPHRVEARQEDETLVIRRDGQVVEKIKAQQLNLSEWDAARFDALRQRVSSIWGQFNGLYGQLPNLSVDEQVRIKQRMDSMRKDLCKDFREMVDISEKVLGVALEDHYTLYTTCSDGGFA